jgi:hypothetical protein
MTATAVFLMGTLDEQDMVVREQIKVAELICPCLANIPIWDNAGVQTHLHK